MAGQFPTPGGGVEDTTGVGGGVYPSPSAGVTDVEAGNATAALAGTKVAVQFGTISPAGTHAITGNKIGTALGTLGVLHEVALTRNAAGVQFGTLSPVRTAALTRNIVGVQLGSMDSGLAPALAGNPITVHLGTLGPAYSAVLTGNQVGVQPGSVKAAGSRTLAGNKTAVHLGQVLFGTTQAIEGFEVAADLGAMVSGVSIGLTGNKVRVRQGRLDGPPEIYHLAWALEPIWLTQTLPSYLYVQYNDDDDLLRFVEVQNSLQQQLLDWFTTIDLPVYTGPQIAGALLDWVAEGLYGQRRPTLPSGFNRNLGPYNTFEYNLLPYNGYTTIESTDVFVTTDDVFKRIITWNFFKGDGRQFSVRWLKRRVMRFLLGENGTDPGVDQTYQVSVTFSGSNQVDIRILSGLRFIIAGAVYNGFAYNTEAYNGYETVFIQYVPLEFAPIFKAAVESGALQLPFQFDWVVTV